MIHSLIQILVFQVLFLAIYETFLKKETFFNLNRIYLLLTPILGAALPFISVDFIQKSIPQEYVVQLPAVVVGETISEAIPNATSFWLPSLLDLWLFGIALSAVIFIWKIFRITKIYLSGNTVYFDGLKLKILPKTDTAFSFFNTIYLGENISEEKRSSIVAHEKIHIQQKHTLDLLFFEILRIIFWFNPLIYVFQNRMATLHEFIADEKLTAENDKKQYYQNLLSEVFKTEKISFINTFFNQSLIKKRISMLQKSKSRKAAQLKYLLLLPAICAMLIYTEEIPIVRQSDSEVMNKINELAEAIMKKGEMTPEEEKALKLLTTEAQPGDKVYTSVQEYLNETEGEGDMSVAFSEIERVPTYPGCSGDNETLKKCFTERISAFVGENFNTKLGKDLGLTGIQRIVVKFKIDKSGNIVRATAKAPKPELEAEALRIIEKLPQMQPGEQKGEKVGVLYSLPIVFEVQ